MNSYIVVIQKQKDQDNIQLAFLQTPSAPKIQKYYLLDSYHCKLLGHELIKENIENSPVILEKCVILKTRGHHFSCDILIHQKSYWEEITIIGDKYDDWRGIEFRNDELTKTETMLFVHRIEFRKLGGALLEVLSGVMEKISVEGIYVFEQPDEENNTGT